MDDHPVRRRTRAGVGVSGDASSSSVDRSSSPAHKSSSAIDRTFTYLITFCVLLACALLTLVQLRPEWVPNLDKTLGSMGIGERVHAVVIDAGSTGSRVLAFTFRRSLLDQQLILEDELWLQVKPGLSSYADEPKAAAESIRGLLNQAKAKIPSSSWAATPITLKATAGLRLLPKDQSEAIIKEVEKELRDSGFQPEENLIEIMNPMEEGLFAWFTVNFLLEKFSSSGPDRSHASLDLGGGSTQITYAPTEAVPDLEGRKHFLHNVTVLKENVEVYSHSYLGMGLMAARKSIFQVGNPAGVKDFVSPCVKSKHPLSWKFQGEDYTIQGTEQSSFHYCIENVLKVVQEENVHIPSELKSREIAAFSYFYDKAVERDLIPRETEGKVRVGDYLQAAKRMCDPQGVNDSGFYCVDLSFIYSLLSQGYGLPDDKELTLYKKIHGHEASWALGCAYNILERD